MSDSYLSISAIANDEFMQERMKACVTQQTELGSVEFGEPLSWVVNNRYVWASSPDWGAAWDSALAGGNEEPGKDSSVITDDMILATVQHLGGTPTE